MGTCMFRGPEEGGLQEAEGGEVGHRSERKGQRGPWEEGHWWCNRVQSGHMTGRMSTGCGDTTQTAHCAPLQPTSACVHHTTAQ